MRRCYFVQHKTTKEKAATTTIWWDYIDERRHPWLHWVAVSPEHQGKGIAKAVLSYTLNQAINIEGDTDIYLHTQTWSYKAINIYRKFGFEFVDKPKIGRWNNENYAKMLEVIAPYLK